MRRRFPVTAYAYFAVMAGVFITAFYSFRMLFLAFHGKERFADERPRPSTPARMTTTTGMTMDRRRKAPGWSRCR